MGLICLEGCTSWIFSSCGRCSRLTTGTSATRSRGLRKGQSPCELLGGLSGFLSRRCWSLRPCVESVPEPEDSSPVPEPEDSSPVLPSLSPEPTPRRLKPHGTTCSMVATGFLHLVEPQARQPVGYPAYYANCVSDPVPDGGHLSVSHCADCLLNPW